MSLNVSGGPIVTPLIPDQDTSPKEEPKALETIAEELSPVTEKAGDLKKEVKKVLPKPPEGNAQKPGYFDAVGKGYQTYELIQGDVSFGNVEGALKGLDMALKKGAALTKFDLEKSKLGLLPDRAARVTKGLGTVNGLRTDIQNFAENPNIDTANDLAETFKDTAEKAKPATKAAIKQTITTAKSGKGVAKTLATGALNAIKSPTGKTLLKVGAKGLGRAMPVANAVILASDVYDFGKNAKAAWEDPSAKNLTKAGLSGLRAGATAVGVAFPPAVIVTAPLGAGLELAEAALDVDWKKVGDKTVEVAKDVAQKTGQVVKEGLQKAKEVGQAAYATTKAVGKAVYNEGKKVVTQAKAVGKKVYNEGKKVVTQTYAKAKAVGKKVYNEGKKVVKKTYAQAKAVGKKVYNQGKALVAKGATVAKKILSWRPW